MSSDATAAAVAPAATTTKKEKTLEERLMHAIRWGDLDNVEATLAAGADVIAARDDSKRPPLLLAAYAQHENVVERLLTAPGIELDAVDDHGNTAVMHAVMKGNADITQRLVDAGCNLKVVNEFGKCAVDIAMKHNQMPMVQLLKDGGAFSDSEDDEK